MITEASEEFILSEILLSVMWLKHSFFIHWRDCFLYDFFQIFFIATIHQYNEVEGCSIFFPLPPDL